MNPDHDSLAPGGPSQTESLSPELPLFTTNTLNLSPLFFLSAFHILEVSRDPLVFSALVDEFHTVFLKCGDRI